jgi:hypothetical protein
MAKLSNMPRVEYCTTSEGWQEENYVVSCQSPGQHDYVMAMRISAHAQSVAREAFDAVEAIATSILDRD